MFHILPLFVLFKPGLNSVLPYPFFPHLFLLPRKTVFQVIMPLKQTYASINVTEPDVDLNQHQFLPLVRHHQYYIPRGDLYIQVQNVLFRMHSYFFNQKSDEFRKLLLEHSQQSYSGLFPSYPLFLPNTNPETLANVLWSSTTPSYPSMMHPSTSGTPYSNSLQCGVFLKSRTSR